MKPKKLQTPAPKSILKQSFYNERTKQGEFNSVQFIEKYLAKHGIDEMLKQTFGQLTQSKELPRNPYAAIYRSLSLEIYEKNLTMYFEETPNRRMLTNNLSSSEESPMLNSLQIDNDRSVYGSNEILTYLSRKSCETMLNYHQKQPPLKDHRIHQVLSCLGGTTLLSNPMLQYPQSSNRPIQLTYYLLFTTPVQSCSVTFAEIIANQALRFIKQPTPQLTFTSLTIQNLSSEYTSTYIWHRADVLLFRAKLVKEIARSAQNSAEVVIVTLELYSGGRTGQGSYRYVRRRYVMVGKSEEGYENMEMYPMSAIWRGVFTRRDEVEMYLRINGADQGDQQAAKQLFFLDQGKRIIKHLHLQDLRSASWQLFYFCITKSDQLYEQLLDKLILNVLAGQVSQLAFIENELQAVLGRIQQQMYNDKNEIEAVLEQILARLKGVLEKGRNTYVLTFREVLVKLAAYVLEEAVKGRTYRQKLRALLLHLTNTLRCIVLNCDQIEFGLRFETFKIFLQFMQQNTEEQQPNNQLSSLIFFQDAMQNKQRPQLLNLQSESQRLKSQLKLSTDRQASDLVFISYLRQFNFFDNIYGYYLELFFGGKPGYPLAHLLSCLSEFNFHTEYFGAEEHRIEEIFTQEQIREVGLTKELTIDSVRELGFEIVGFHGNVRYVNLDQLRKVKEFIDIMPLNRSQLKIPLNCEVSEIFSVSGQHLLSSSTYIQQTLPVLYINIDIIIRGGTPRQSDTIFYEIILQKCRAIESNPKMGVIGLFSHRDRQQTFKIYDNKLPFTLDEFKQFAESVESMYLKLVLMVEDRIKVVNYRVNLHTEGRQGEIVHLHNTNMFHMRNRVFFSIKDILSWSRITDLKPLTQHKYFYYQDLDMNSCIKQYIISSLHLMIERPEDKDSVESIIQILFFYSEKLYFLCKEMLNFFYLIQYIKKDRTGKFQVRETETGLEQLTENIFNITEKYGYCCNEGLTVALMQHCRTIRKYVKSHPTSNGDERELTFLERVVLEVCRILEHNCNTMYLEYRLILKKTNPNLKLII